MGSAHEGSGDRLEREVLWLRSICQQLRVSPLSTASAALIAYVTGGPPPGEDELPRTPAELDAVRRLVGGMPRELMARATESVTRYEEHVSRMEAGPGAAGRGRRELLTRYDGPWVLDADGGSSVLVEGRSDLAAELRSRDLPDAQAVAAALELVGADVELAAGMNDIGGLVERLLGVTRARGPLPDLAGYELKTTLGSGDRPFTYMFGMAPAWLVPRQEILARHGRAGRFRAARVKARGDHGASPFRLTVEGDAVRLVALDGEALMEWSALALEARVRQKMPRLIKLIGRREGSSHVVIRQGIVFVGVRAGEFARLLRSRNLYLNVKIPPQASRATYEFFLNTTGFARLYESRWTLRPAERTEAAIPEG